MAGRRSTGKGLGVLSVAEGLLGLALQFADPTPNKTLARVLFALAIVTAIAAVVVFFWPSGETETPTHTTGWQSGSDGSQAVADRGAASQSQSGSDSFQIQGGVGHTTIVAAKEVHLHQPLDHIEGSRSTAEADDAAADVEPHHLPAPARVPHARDCAEVALAITLYENDEGDWLRETKCSRCQASVVDTPEFIRKESGSAAWAVAHGEYEIDETGFRSVLLLIWGLRDELREPIFKCEVETPQGDVHIYDLRTRGVVFNEASSQGVSRVEFKRKESCSFPDRRDFPTAPPRPLPSGDYKVRWFTGGVGEELLKEDLFRIEGKKLAF